jgi:hypothetical protein
MHSKCDNCERDGRGLFKVGDADGIFCQVCGEGFSSWACIECGARNPVARTLFRLERKGSCFIATVAYGSPFAPEMATFYRLRDEVLLALAPGRAFVRAYYAISPSIARQLSKSQLLRKATRRLLLNPLARLIKAAFRF